MSLINTQILLFALRDFAKSKGYTDLDNTLDRLTQNTCRMEQDFERYKVWPTDSDRAVYDSIYRAGSPIALSAGYPLVRRKYTKKYFPRPRLVEAYLYFHEAISKFARPVDSPDSDAALDDAAIVERLEALLEVLTRSLELVVIELEERDDPQVIFETLNSGGEPLLPSDLIRNFVFLEATRRGKR